MADSNRDTLSAARALSHRVPSSTSASNRNCPRPLQQMAPSAPPPQFPLSTWAGNLSSGTYPQRPTPNATVAQSASSSSQAQGPRPNTNRPTYAHPPTINFWTCCQCEFLNHPFNCPVLCGDCPHRKCTVCS